jgi:transposase-like protein
MRYDADSFAASWTRRPLCRRYATAVIRRSLFVPDSAVHGSSPSIWWALGTLNDGGTEFLGAWINLNEYSGLPPDVFGQLCERGVLSIRFCIGNLGDAERVFRETLRHAAVMPSLQELLATADATAKPRHRVKVAQMLRAVDELEDVQAARAKFGEFQGSELGERYPEIVHQWDEALSRSESFYALDAPLRELVRSADQMAADVSECLRRAIKRHGQVTDYTAALDFVVACLDKVERGLDRDRAAALASGSARLAFRRRTVSAPDAAGLLTPA